MANCCPHVTKATGLIEDDEWNRIVTNPAVCRICQEQGNNFWLCLYPGCHFIGCSDADGGQDHSTQHFNDHPTHCIQVNLSTCRAWCYICNKETTTPFLIRLRNKVKNNTPNCNNKTSSRMENEEYVAKASDPVESNPFNDHQQHREDSAVVGLTGLANLGNTCYMNSALQCLSNVPALTEFFLSCSTLVTKADQFNGIQRDKPSLSQAYFGLLNELWSSRRVQHSYVPPTKLLYAFKSAHPMFRGYHQQDSQEFLRCFMDQLHEELMEPLNELECHNEDDHDGDDHNANGVQEVELDRNLGSVSETENESVSPDDEEDQEYETADSGVSEESNNSTLNDIQAPLISSSTSRKRKRQNSKVGDGSLRANPDEDQLSPSSDGESEFLDAASSRSASPPNIYLRTMSNRTPTKVPAGNVMIKRKPKTYRSVITDVFDGKLISSVQCLTCDRVSTTTETFQDLSLPIPSQEAMNNLRQSKSSSSSSASSSTSVSGSLSTGSDANSGWFSWMWSWLGEWIYGPNISLQDCLAYFFSADELKGDNMYSCEKCKKLRNGLKYSRVTVLPETLCIHLKRFRHEFAFSSKIGSKVTFPLVDLDMGPWLHRQDCISKEIKYDLIGVICHHGTAGGGHYTAYALNNIDQEWYEYDDSYVTKVEAATVMNAEAYVLFYRKNNFNMEPRREELQTYLDQEAGLVKFYISRQWLNKFENFAEPGPVDNSDFLCPHGGVLPSKFAYVNELCVAFPQNAWNFLHSTFGGGPACCRLYECSICKDELDTLNHQKEYELESFKQLHAQFQESVPDSNNVMYCLSSSWFKQWEQFVLGRQRDPPSQIDNKSIVTARFNDRQPTLRPTADYLRVSQDIWKLFHSIYGGGPEVILRSNGTSMVILPSSSRSINSNNVQQAGSLKHRNRSASESTVSTSVLSSSPPK